MSGRYESSSSDLSDNEEDIENESRGFYTSDILLVRRGNECAWARSHAEMLQIFLIRCSCRGHERLGQLEPLVIDVAQALSLYTRMVHIVRQHESLGWGPPVDWNPFSLWNQSGCGNLHIVVSEVKNDQYPPLPQKVPKRIPTLARHAVEWLEVFRGSECLLYALSDQIVLWSLGWPTSAT
jgi:hypothetical protein